MPNPEDLITVIQAAAFRRESGSPLSQNAIRDAVAAGKLNRYSLPVTGAKLLVSRAEVEAYQPTGHKPKGYKHKSTTDQARKRYRRLKRDSDQSHYDAGCYRVPMPEISPTSWRMEHSENCPSGRR